VNGVPPPGTPLTFEWHPAGHFWSCRYTGTDAPVGLGDDKAEAYEHLVRQMMRRERDG